jgi:aspartate carbamoyltransferase regulatory subunit
VLKRFLNRPCPGTNKYVTADRNRRLGSYLSRREELYVKKIRDGTVIDHIAPGHALDVLRILNINGKEGIVVSIAMNVSSKRFGKKDIVKIEERQLAPQELDKIALIAPNATINIVKDYSVTKKEKVHLPDTITGIVRCANPACISNSKEPVVSNFRVESSGPLIMRCRFCGRIMEKDDVLKQF